MGDGELEEGPERTPLIVRKIGPSTVMTLKDAAWLLPRGAS